MEGSVEPEHSKEMTMLSREVCAALMLAFGHFLWQGTAIALIAAVTARRIKSASRRYGVFVAGLLLMSVSAAGTLGWVWPRESQGSGLQISKMATHDAVAGDKTESPILKFEDPTTDARDWRAGERQPPDVEANADGNRETDRTVRGLTHPGSLELSDSRWQRVAPWLTSAYLAGVGVMLLRLLVGLWGGWRLRRRAVAIDDVALLAALKRQARALGLTFEPLLAYCEQVAVPTVIGILKPTILLPLAITSGLSPEQIESVLAHELAHLKRHDHLVNLLQRVIESLLFFHPAVWWVSRHIRIEREHCCDDLVITCGAIPLDYATSLLRVAELSRAAQRSRSVPAVSLFATDDKPSNLRQRIARLLGESSTPSLRVSPRALLLAIGIPLVALIATIQSGASPQQPEQKIDATANAESLPAEPARLQVKDLWGSKALFNDVVKATVGFPKTSPDVWVRSPNREGIVSLDGLPVGAHWLLAAGNSRERLPFQVTIPTEQPLLEQRLRYPAWLGKKVELAVQPVAEVDEKAGEVIVIEILNQSNEALSFSEEDLVLLCELPSEKVRGREWIRGLSPKWLTADREPFPQTKIEAGQSGRMRLNWREWVRKGLWSSRNHEPIAEPGFPPNEPGKIWVKAGLGNGGSLPVSVTDPKDILAESTKHAVKLPNGAEVELSGVAFAIGDRSKHRKVEGWWLADGTNFEGRPPFNPLPMTVHEDDTDLREFAVRVGLSQDNLPPREIGIKWNPAPTQSGSGGGSTEGDPNDGDATKLLYFAGFGEKKSVAVQVYYTAPPLVASWPVDATTWPKQLDERLMNRLRKFIHIEKVEKSRTETILRFQWLPNPSEPAELFIRAIDRKGQPHDARESRNSNAGDDRVFSIPATDIESFEISVRPQTQRITFENVSLVPGQKSDVKVTVEPVDRVTVQKAGVGKGIGTVHTASGSVEVELGQRQENVAWTHDSQEVFSAGDFKTLLQWRRHESKWVPTAFNANNIVNSIAVSRKSPLIVLGTNVGTAEVWDATNRKLLSELRSSPEHSVYAVAISPDDKLVAICGTDGTVAVFDLASRQLIARLGEKADTRMSSLAFSPDGKTLAAMDRGGQIVLWNLAERTRHAEWKGIAGGEDCSVQWTPNGQRLAVSGPGRVTLISAEKGSQPQVVMAPEEVLSRFPIADDSSIESVSGPLPGGIKFASVTAISPDVRTVASITPNASIEIWNLATRKIVKKLSAPAESAIVKEWAGPGLRHLVFSPDGRRLACTSTRGDVIFWQLAEVAEVKPDALGSTEPPSQLRVLHDDGTPATFNHVVQASIGFPDVKFRPWMEHRDRDGLVSLAKLPVGNHWLVAAPEFATRTAFLLTMPPTQPLVEQRLLTPPAWISAGEFSLVAGVVGKGTTDEEIAVTIRNSSNAALSIGEEDLSLTMFSGDYRILSPALVQLEADRPARLTIGAGTAGGLSINWRKWVQRGLWVSRAGEQIDEPWSAQDVPGKIQVRVEAGHFGAVPVFMTDPKTQPLDALVERAPEPDPHRAQATVKQQSVEVKSNAEQQPAELELLRKLVRGGKLDTKTINASITLVAARGAQDTEFARLVLAEFEKSCEGEDRTAQSRRHLLAVLTDIFEAWSSPSWRAQLGRFKSDDLPQSVPPQMDEKLGREMLARVIQYGYATDRSEIANFSLAVRQLHHPAGREFLRGVLRNPGSGSDPFAPSNPPMTVPPQATPTSKSNSGVPTASRWKDNTGGGWTDAKFVAAVGLAELGEAEGIDWLLARAQPNKFGIDASLWSFPHIRESRGSLRECSRFALADLFGLPAQVTVTKLENWWRNNRATFTARPAMLKPRAGRGSPALDPTNAAAGSGESRPAQPDGLEFLKPYPKMHGLSLNMTEPQFLEIVKQQELNTRKTVNGEKVTHHIALGDDHTLIVMFDKDAKCSGIQRVWGEFVDDEAGAPAPKPKAPLDDWTDSNRNALLNPPPKRPLSQDVSRNESGYPLLNQNAEGELADGWIACEFGLQYRVLTYTPRLVAGELPLLFVDVRNRGTFKDMGLELHQSRHVLVVDGKPYERRDLPWAGVTALEPDGPPLTLAFALSDDWKREGETKTPLRLARGTHQIAVSLVIAAVYPPQTDEPQTAPQRTPIRRTLVCLPIQFEVRGAWGGSPGSLGLENIRRELIAMPDFHSPKVPANLQRLVQEHQPAAGDELIKLLKSDDSNSGFQQAAAVVFADAWDSMNREQIERYLLATMTHFVGQRSQYPQGVDASIGMGTRHRPGYLGLPTDRRYSAETVTTHYVDGQQIDKPYSYPGLGAQTHWIKTKDLSLGRHTFRLATKYTFTRGNETYRGSYESSEFAFEMVPANTPDDLIAPKDEQLDRLVLEALRIAETDRDLRHPPGEVDQSSGRIVLPDNDPWHPQITWETNKLGVASLHTPVWKLAKRLPVDLCFSVEFRIENTDTAIRCYDLVALADHEGQGYFSTLNFDQLADFLKHADKDGFVSGRLVLKPSRSVALTETKVKRYYNGEITSRPLRFKVVTVANAANASSIKRDPLDPATKPEATLGTLSGRFVYDGPLPIPKTVRHKIGDIPPGEDADLIASLNSPEEASLLVAKDGGIANVVVWAVSQDIPWTPQAPLSPVTIHLKDDCYSPRITTVTVGQPLRVEIQDAGVHNFRLANLRNPSVNQVLTREAKDHPLRLSFSEPEKLPREYRSDIPPNPRGWLLIHSTPYVAISHPDGSFTLPSLPPGEWEFRAWHERDGKVQRWPKNLFKQTIKPGENKLGNIKLKFDFVAG